MKQIAEEGIEDLALVINILKDIDSKLREVGEDVSTISREYGFDILQYANEIESVANRIIEAKLKVMPEESNADSPLMSPPICDQVPLSNSKTLT